MIKTLQAMLVGPDYGMFRQLQSYLMKIGFRGTSKCDDPSEIQEVIATKRFPVILINLNSESSDGFALFDQVRKTPGLELAPLVWFHGERDKYFQDLAVSFGGLGSTTRPFKPAELNRLLNSVVNSHEFDQAAELALRASDALMHKHYDQALKPLSMLEKKSVFHNGATIALSRCLVGLGRESLAEKKLKHLIQQAPRKAFLRCEYIDYLMERTRHLEALKQLKILHSMDSRITLKCWERVQLAIALDELSEATKYLCQIRRVPILEEDALEGLLKICHMLGLIHLIPQILNQSPKLKKRYDPQLAMILNREAS